MSNNAKNKMLFATVLIILGILFRTVWHLGDNVEFVTSATLIASAYLGLRFSILVPFMIMALSDLIIGNTNIFIFTWSGYLFIGFLSNLSNLGNLRGGTKILVATGLGILASLWFYLWTNFGVWLLDSFGMYPKTLTGLIDAYIMGIPFLKYNLYGNLVLVPASFLIAEAVKLFFGNWHKSFYKKKSHLKI